MNRKAIATLRRTLVVSVAVLGASMGPAAATTTHAAIGTSFSGPDRTNFTVNTNGVTRAGSGTGSWMMPLVFDTAGAKTITVKGRVISGSGASIVCTGLVFDNTGTQVSSSGAVTMPVTSTFTSLSLTLSTIPFGGTGIVFCNLTGPGNHTLLGLDYPS